jgi:hypothetical protein
MKKEEKGLVNIILFLFVGILLEFEPDFPSPPPETIVRPIPASYKIYSQQENISSSFGSI